MKMLHKSLCQIASKVWDCKITPSRNSALFINRAKATEHFIYLTPHIDFPERIQNKKFLQEELQRRKANIELGKVENLWQLYEALLFKKQEYVDKQEELSKRLSTLMSLEPENDSINILKTQHDLIKENIKKLKEPLNSAEEAAMVEVLKLPNRLHTKTPDEENKLLYTHLSPPKKLKNHLEIGKDLNILQFTKNENYYLKGDAALFELGAKFYFNKVLRANNFVQFSNPDFVKSLIVEGCGKDHTNPDATFILHHNETTKLNTDSRLHLTGGASLGSFLAYHAKNVLPAKAFPLKYFTMGRQYIPAPSDEDSLFHVSQSSAIEFFGATKTEKDLDKVLEEIINILKDAYGMLDYHFRLSLVPAHKLHMWESLRVALEMYSVSLKDYVEVANVSLSGQFISKRLMFTFVENKENHFPYIISGTILNVPKLLACVLELDAEFCVPELFKITYWPKNEKIPVDVQSL